MARSKVDLAVEALHVSMRTLRATLRGIPVNQDGFRGMHDDLARDVAVLAVELETVAAYSK